MTRGVLEQVAVDWRLDPLLAAALVAAATAYVVAALRARRWAAWRTAAFLGGVALVGIVLLSGLHGLSEELLSLHMVQHLVLVLVAPPLLLLGEPLALALRTLPPAARRRLARAVHGRVARTAAHPAVALALFTAVLVASHVPAVYEAALRSELLHAIEHAGYLWASALFWIAVLGAAPTRSSPLVRLLTLLASMPPMALIGVGLMGSHAVLYPSYLPGAEHWGVSALADQRAAAALMWIGGSTVLIVCTLFVAASALRREEARMVSREAHARRRAASGRTGS